MLEGFHLDVARILGYSTAPEGFALGGGYGLQAYNILDRPSEDLDAYADSVDPEVFSRAEARFVESLGENGFDCVVVKSEDWFRGIEVTNPATGECVVVDLGYDYRSLPPVLVEGIGPVLNIEDIVFGKVRAFVDREAERDFVDIDAILQDGRWTPTDLFEKVNLIRPEITRQDFSEALKRSDLGDPIIYAGLGLDSQAQLDLGLRLSSAANWG